MTKYREIIRLHCQGYSKRNIALSVSCSRNTAARVADVSSQAKCKVFRLKVQSLFRVA